MGLECIAKMQRRNRPQSLGTLRVVAMGLECIAKMQRYERSQPTREDCRNGFRVHREDATLRRRTTCSRACVAMGLECIAKMQQVDVRSTRLLNFDVAMGLECIAKMQPFP